MTRTNSAKQLSLGREPLLPRRALRRCRLFANVFRSSQDERARDRSAGTSANDFRRLLGSRWYVNTTQDFLNSEEQGLDLRTTIGGGGGRYLTALVVAAPGARRRAGVDQRELHRRGAADEGLGRGVSRHGVHDREAEDHRPHHPVHVLSQPDDFRSVPTERTGSTWTSTCRATGISGFGFFDNYDSQPPAGFSKNDYGWSNAFGFKF